MTCLIHYLFAFAFVLQVDHRILKAVASQYSSDVDAAVGFVFSDVLPAVSEPTETHYTLQDIDYDKHDHTDCK
jgi:hypothetical protein